MATKNSRNLLCSIKSFLAASEMTENKTEPKKNYDSSVTLQGQNLFYDTYVIFVRCVKPHDRLTINEEFENSIRAFLSFWSQAGLFKYTQISWSLDACGHCSSCFDCFNSQRASWMKNIRWW